GTTATSRPPACRSAPGRRRRGPSPRPAVRRRGPSPPRRRCGRGRAAGRPAPRRARWRWRAAGGGGGRPRGRRPTPSRDGCGRRVGATPVERLVNGGGAEEAAADAGVLGGEAVQLVEADAVDLLGGDVVERGVAADEVVVEGPAFGEPAQAGPVVGPPGWQQL